MPQPKCYAKGIATARLAALARLAVLTVAGLAGSALAYDFELGDSLHGKFGGTLTFGTMLRTETPSPDDYGTLSAARVGATPGYLGGNTGGPDLNFKRGQPVSTVLKGSFDLDLSRDGIGVFARARAWYDYALRNGSRAYGNMPNGFQQNVPLSDSRFEPEARFDNLLLEDVYVYGRFQAVGATAVDARIGRQVLNWGGAQLIGGGINIINPSNIAAQVRPGALPQEGKVPIGMAYANWTLGENWGVEAFLPYEFRPMVYPGCGTFFDISSEYPTGCNFASVIGSINDPKALATGIYLHRRADVLARDSGQYGLSLRYKADGLNTELRGYAMNYHSRTPVFRGYNANVAGGYGTLAPSFTRLTDPNGLAFALLFPEDIRLFGLSFVTRLDATLRIYGEASYRPNQPLELNTADFSTAFISRSPNSALNLALATNSLPPGTTYDDYNRFKVSTATLGINKAWANILGAERLTFEGEIGLSHVGGLPDPGVLRYGRLNAYGIAAINGVACVDTTVAQKSCAQDGFITGNAWGFRTRLSARYPGAFFGAVLTPSLAYNQDVSGYSYDGSFKKDRKLLRPSLRADWRKDYFAELRYTIMSGGAYNLLADRDNATLVVGMNF